MSCDIDSLATKIRYFLRKKKVDMTSITTVFSTERAQVALLPLTQNQRQDPQAYGNIENMRVRIMPVLGTMPAIFGQSMAAFVLSEICNRPLRPEQVARLSRELRNKFYQQIQQLELHTGKFCLDKNDIDFIVQGMWKNKCAVTGKRMGDGRLVLSKWKRDLPALPFNIVLLTLGERNRLQRAEGNPEDAFHPEIVKQINDRLQDWCGSTHSWNE